MNTSSAVLVNLVFTFTLNCHPGKTHDHINLRVVSETPAEQEIQCNHDTFPRSFTSASSPKAAIGRVLARRP